jgi:hypothetical protein
LVIFALEISGLRQLCCRFFLFSCDFPAAAQPQTYCSLFALSASKDRAYKPFIFLFLQTPWNRENARKSFTINQLRSFCQDGGGVL